MGKNCSSYQERSKPANHKRKKWKHLRKSMSWNSRWSAEVVNPCWMRVTANSTVKTYSLKQWWLRVKLPFNRQSSACKTWLWMKAPSKTLMRINRIWVLLEAAQMAGSSQDAVRQLLPETAFQNSKIKKLRISLRIKKTLLLLVFTAVEAISLTTLRSACSRKSTVRPQTLHKPPNSSNPTCTSSAMSMIVVAMVKLKTNFKLVGRFKTRAHPRRLIL